MSLCFIPIFALLILIYFSRHARVYHCTTHRAHALLIVCCAMRLHGEKSVVPRVQSAKGKSIVQKGACYRLNVRLQLTLSQECGHCSSQSVRDTHAVSVYFVAVVQYRTFHNLHTVTTLTYNRYSTGKFSRDQVWSNYTVINACSNCQNDSAADHVVSVTLTQ